MTQLTSSPSALPAGIQEKIPKAKLLVVGAGGIGCEVLKNLAISGFQDIEIIDLDTIDVSNLNRQFLFRKEHVGKPKAVVARESILAFNPAMKIQAHHDNITSQEYGLNFFKRFDMVLNALDNRLARSHVNRMCLAADVPLIESGTMGYNGQCEVIKKGVLPCYECTAKGVQRTFPGCTIRNTPSEPVHCIVWAKHLFNQLFGEDDPDQDVSPDAEDPEAKKEGDESAHTITESGDVKRVSTRQWVQDIKYDPAQLFTKFFFDDIKYLLTMENLWKTRKAPTPLNWDEAASHEGDTEVVGKEVNPEMVVWSLSKCAKVFSDTVAELREQMQSSEFLVWDKDIKPAMDFVTAAANVRSHIFGIQKQSPFETKSLAGNIIPAIATSNAIVAGIVGLYAIRVLSGDFQRCGHVHLRPKAIDSPMLLSADPKATPPNPNCHVCAPNPTVQVQLNTKTMLLKELEAQVLKGYLNMIAPDVVLAGKESIVLSSEEGETEANNNCTLESLGIVDGCILKADDFQQNYELSIHVTHFEQPDPKQPLFIVQGNPEEMKAKEEDKTEEKMDTQEEKQTTSTEIEDDDDLLIVEPDADAVEEKPAPAAVSDVAEAVSEAVVIDSDEDPQEGSSSKKRRLNPPEDEDFDDDVCIIMDD